MSFYLGSFSNNDDVIKEFDMSEEEAAQFLSGETLLAYYGLASYSGEAYVLFTVDGKLFDVVGDHCSCYGLEKQWKPDETSVEALWKRVLEGRLGEAYATLTGQDGFRNELLIVLNTLGGDK